MMVFTGMIGIEDGSTARNTSDGAVVFFNLNDNLSRLCFQSGAGKGCGIALTARHFALSLGHNVGSKR
jgi:hypothetical protein